MNFLSSGGWILGMVVVADGRDPFFRSEWQCLFLTGLSRFLYGGFVVNAVSLFTVFEELWKQEVLKARKGSNAA